MHHRQVQGLKAAGGLERLLITLIAFIGFTVADIVASPIWTKDISLYQHWFGAWMIVLTTLFVILGFSYRSILLPITFLILATNGSEDLFYYLMQLQLPPAELPWLMSPLVIQPATAGSTYVGAIWGFSLLLFVAFLPSIRNAFNRTIEHTHRLVDASL